MYYELLSCFQIFDKMIMVNVNDPLMKEKTDTNVSKQLSDVT